MRHHHPIMTDWNGFNVRKAAQVVAFIAMSAGGRINVLALSKLVYLSDREFLRRYDMPILFDQLVSMDHGPVDSHTLNFVSGFFSSSDWDEFVSARENYTIGSSKDVKSVDQLDELSDAEIEVLTDIWREFGKMDKYVLRDYTHENCKEWEPPHGSSAEIPYARVFKFLGKANISDLCENVEMIRALGAEPESDGCGLHTLQARDAT